MRQQDEADAPPAPEEAAPPRVYAAAPLAPAAPAAPPVPIAVPPANAGEPMSDDAMRRMGVASGWDPAGARRAAVSDALATLSCF